MRDACVALGLPDDRGACPCRSSRETSRSTTSRPRAPDPAVADRRLLRRARRLAAGAAAALPRPGIASTLGRLVTGGAAHRALDLLGGAGAPPRLDPARGARAIYAVLDAIERGLVRSPRLRRRRAAGRPARDVVARGGADGPGPRLDLGGSRVPPIEACWTSRGGFLLEVDPEREAGVRPRYAAGFAACPDRRRSATRRGSGSIGERLGLRSSRSSRSGARGSASWALDRGRSRRERARSPSFSFRAATASPRPRARSRRPAARAAIVRWNEPARDCLRYSRPMSFRADSPTRTGPRRRGRRAPAASRSRARRAAEGRPCSESATGRRCSSRRGWSRGSTNGSARGRAGAEPDAGPRWLLHALGSSRPGPGAGACLFTRRSRGRAAGDADGARGGTVHDARPGVAGALLDMSR